MRRDQWPMRGLVLGQLRQVHQHRIRRAEHHGARQRRGAGIADRQDNVLKNAPHTAAVVMADEWTHAYGRERAAFPAEWVRERKFWPHVSRVNSAAGDRNLVCSCPPVDMYAQV